MKIRSRVFATAAALVLAGSAAAFVAGTAQAAPVTYTDTAIAHVGAADVTSTPSPGLSVGSLTNDVPAGTIHFTVSGGLTPYKPATQAVAIGSQDATATIGSGGVVTLALDPGDSLAPDVYHNVTITITDSSSTAESVTVVLAVRVYATKAPSFKNLGDFVNDYGAGPDVWQQQYIAGADAHNWTVTKTDPATQFLLINLSDPSDPLGLGNTFMIEAYNGSYAVNLCLTNDSNTAVWEPCVYSSVAQEFTLNASGNVVSQADGLILTPDGIGSVLTFTATGTPWPGGSVYKWVPRAHEA